MKGRGMMMMMNGYLTDGFLIAWRGMASGQIQCKKNRHIAICVCVLSESTTLWGVQLID